MQLNNKVHFQIISMPPQNTNSVVVSFENKAIIFDAWGYESNWTQFLLENKLTLLAIYSTHGHPDHICSAPTLAKKFNIDWFLNDSDKFLIGWGNEILDMFKLPHISPDYKQPLNIIPNTTIELFTSVFVNIIPAPGHTPGGVMFYFPQYKFLITGDTIFADGYGRYDLPGGNYTDLQNSIHNLVKLNLPDDTFVVHGHGQNTTIGWLKQNNQFFL